MSHLQKTESEKIRGESERRVDTDQRKEKGRKEGKKEGATPASSAVPSPSRPPCRTFRKQKENRKLEKIRGEESEDVDTDQRKEKGRKEGKKEGASTNLQAQLLSSTFFQAQQQTEQGFGGKKERSERSGGR